VLKSVRDKENRKRLLITVISVLQNLLTFLIRKCLPILTARLNLYYTKLQYNLITIVNASLLIYLFRVTRLITLTSLLRV